MNTLIFLQKYFETVGEVDIEPELHVDVIERNWNRLIMAHQERDQNIHEEIKRFLIFTLLLSKYIKISDKIFSSKVLKNQNNAFLVDYSHL